ncbi:MAG: glycosyltransferase [Pantoea sp.]|uniref:Glycosyltransferase n=1 Tax=Pantoea brenneri TaxID=472694 RepID=A0AAX3J887_9GAMM|nr:MULTISPECIES: glycosyltransferase [Pantoea]MBS6032991.1 glycosyltransferase [Pantoea sp.]MDH2123707.1 glycosyltransferase [Pantoea brenneri]VXB81152.1 Glycosyltransferase [Pantoea brenneri]
MKNLKELYQEHHGKSSDKWDIYLETYHNILSGKKKNLKSLLEIGVQNGGSLEIWSKYFQNAENIVGCDINPDCARLEYANKSIKVVIGNSSTPEIKNKIEEISPSFDLIIDDGSHNSSDIIKSFLLYFPLLEQDGIYIVEDLHCSYWQEWEGGLYDPYSSMAFLKKLADITNFEHWGIERSASDYLSSFFEHYDSAQLDKVDYSEIHSVCFINSLCIITKKSRNENLLGLRHVVGEDEGVVVGNLELNGIVFEAPEQTENPWSNLSSFPEMEWKDLVTQNISLSEQLSVSARQINLYKRIEDVLRNDIDDLKAQLSNQSELANRLNFENNALLNSTSWKITAPMRKAVLNARRVKKAVKVVQTVVTNYGVKGSVNRTFSLYKKNGLKGLVRKLYHINNLQVAAQTVLSAKSLPSLTLDNASLLLPRVLIIAEMSIPQCKKYRVDQKVDLFKQLGIPVKTVSWTDLIGCMEALQYHSIVIFYRVPAFDTVLKLFDECDRLNLDTYWEVDDLIFDEDILLKSKTLNELDKDTFKGLIDGARLYHNAMIRCKGVIASTEPLAKAMEKSGSGKSIIIENALDPETIETAESIPALRKSESDGIIRIVYGSGTSTHNVDFLEASEAIYNILVSYPNVHLRLAGVLELPKKFDLVKDQIERIEFCPYADYLRILAECDISIAPLEDYIFNDSKSNIKYLEASILGLPSICSPRPNFASVIDNGVNGFLCCNVEEWESSFKKLIEDSLLRKNIGENAKKCVLQHYSPESVAREQAALVIEDFERLNNNKNKKHVLSVNCYYNPRSFGGATVVAEALNRHFVDDSEFDIHVLTSLPEEYGAINTLRRYEAYGQDCYGIVLPNLLSENRQVINPDIDNAFTDVIDLVQPDIVHFHSIQGLGITMLRICAERNIPIVVTTHDYWWLYEHQFILSFKEEHKFRGNVDAPMSKVPGKIDYLEIKKRDALSLATKIISPSMFTTELYRKEGFAEALLNKNGVTYPQSISPKVPGRPLRFGYAGGNTDIKGYHLVKYAFNHIAETEGKLIIVDNALNLGFKSFHENDLAGLRNVEVVPAFTQDNMDEFFSSIDVLLYPTQSKESFGLTVREALIRNVWVITSDAGGAVEDILPGENGFIIPFNNDGGTLLECVKETIAHFSYLPQTEEVHLPHSHIRTFSEQYEELKDIYRSCIK